MKRYQEYREYENRWLYDSKKDKLYDLIDGYCYICKYNVIQLSKFHPYVKSVAEYDANPYVIKKKTK